MVALQILEYNITTRKTPIHPNMGYQGFLSTKRIISLSNLMLSVSRCVESEKMKSKCTKFQNKLTCLCPSNCFDQNTQNYLWLLSFQKIFLFLKRILSNQGSEIIPFEYNDLLAVKNVAIYLSNLMSQKIFMPPND